MKVSTPQPRQPSQSKAERKLTKLMERIGGSLCTSMRDVPYLLVVVGDTRYSVSYFGKSRVFRLFFPFGAAAQTRLDFKEPAHVARFLKERSVACPAAAPERQITGWPKSGRK